MYSRDETVSAVLRFYRQIIKHPYLDESVLKIPPANGWDSIDVDALKAKGKNDTVIDLLRHLPYLRADDLYSRLLVNHQTYSLCYTKRAYYDYSCIDDLNTLPAHCVYLTDGVDRYGLSLILDTEKGTVTAYSLKDKNLSLEEVKLLPEPQRRKAHLNLPVSEFFETWTRRYEKLVYMLSPNYKSEPTTGLFFSRASDILEENQLVDEELKEWHPDVGDKAAHRAESILLTARVYNAYLEFGWPDNFDKEGCRARLLELTTPKRIYDSKVKAFRPLTGGPPPRRPVKRAKYD